MRVADQDEVKRVLRDREAAIYDIIHGAWHEVKQLPLSGPLEFPRTRACLVHDRMVRLAKVAWVDDPRVRIIAQDETAKFVFDDIVVVRFKKADASGLGANIPTQAVMQFVEQQGELPGIRDVHKVEVLYHLNPLQTQIDHVTVVARDGDRLLWEYPIHPAEDAEVFMFPTAPDEPQRGPLIKIRKPDAGNENTQGE